jgi:hypothetical protein
MESPAHLLQEGIEIRRAEKRIPPERVVRGGINTVDLLTGHDSPRQHGGHVIEDDDIDFTADARRGQVPPELHLRFKPGGSIGVARPIEEHAQVHVTLAVRATLGEAAEHIGRDHTWNRDRIQKAAQPGARIGLECFHHPDDSMVRSIIWPRHVLVRAVTE